MHCVLTADFDVHALSESMALTSLPGVKTLLYANDGTLLAHPEGAAELARMRASPNPYGDGRASERIAQAVAWRFGLAERPADWRV